MTRRLDPDPGFDIRIANWLEADPGDAPDLVLETVLAAFPSIPQLRATRLQRRSRTVNRFVYLAAAAVLAVIAVVAVVGGDLLTPPRPSPSVAATGSTGPTASPTPRSPEPTTNPQGSAMWTATGNMVEIRFGESATLLRNGNVLVAGGNSQWNRRGLSRATAELYDPSTGRWTLTGSMHEARQGFTAVLMANGQVLALGGASSDKLPARLLSSAELYDPSTATWTDTGRMIRARADATATLLGDGSVLVTGGYSARADGPESTAELYDPATGTWARTGTMSVARNGHTATLLPNGHVLVVGGQCCTEPGTASAESYDPAIGTWTVAGTLGSARRNHNAVLLADGKVLVYGGDNGGSSSPPVTTAELYDPVTGVWVATGSPGNAGNLLEGWSARLPDGRVVAIGLAARELYDPASGSWSALGGPLFDGLAPHSATLLVDGRVLVTFEPAAMLLDPDGIP